MNLRIFIMAALLPCCPGPEAAEWYVGGAAHYYLIDNDYTPLDGESGAGFHLIGGLRWEHIAPEVTMGGTSIDTGEIISPYYPADTADYAILDLTVKNLIRSGGNDRLIPWSGVSAGVHFVDLNTYFYRVEGTALSVSAGADYRLFYSCWQFSPFPRMYNTRKGSGYEHIGDNPVEHRAGLQANYSLHALSAYRPFIQCRSFHKTLLELYT
jgi:hypothetical protein